MCQEFYAKRFGLNNVDSKETTKVLIRGPAGSNLTVMLTMIYLILRNSRSEFCISLDGLDIRQ